MYGIGDRTGVSKYSIVVHFLCILWLKTLTQSDAEFHRSTSIVHSESMLDKNYLPDCLGQVKITVWQVFTKQLPNRASTVAVVVFSKKKKPLLELYMFMFGGYLMWFNHLKLRKFSIKAFVNVQNKTLKYMYLNETKLSSPKGRNIYTNSMIKGKIK